MFRQSGAVLLGAMVLAAGCGGGQSSSPPITEPEERATTTTATVEGTRAASTIATPTGSTSTTIASTTTTVANQPATDLAMLRPSGLDSVDFGTPADDAIEHLSALLGPPDVVESITPIGEAGDGCVEGAGWLDCLRDLRVLDEGRLAIWGAHGLEVAFVDTHPNGWPPERTELQFGDWHATVPSGEVHLVTDEGLRPGMTVRELRRAVPGVEFTYNEGNLDSFSVTSGERGGYWGRLDWDPGTDEIESRDVIAVQAALNEHGANLAVDGEWGPRSEAAWLQFLTDHGFETFTSQPWLMPEIGEALGLPPRRHHRRNPGTTTAHRRRRLTALGDVAA